MPAIKPPLVRSFGNNSFWWVPAIANINSPTVLEVNAATGFNLSCSIFGDQAHPDASTAKVQLPRLNCETETYEVNGETNHTSPDFVVSFSPQAAAGADGKKAWVEMTDLETGFLVRRMGKIATGDAVAGEFVDVWPGQLGVKIALQTSPDASGVYAFKVGVSITGQPAFNKALV